MPWRKRKTHGGKNKRTIKHDDLFNRDKSGKKEYRHTDEARANHDPRKPFTRPIKPPNTTMK